MVYEQRFIRGSRFVRHFILDDPSDQVIPKTDGSTIGTNADGELTITAVMDGSETKVIDGNNTRVNGTGTVDDPYRINVLDATPVLRGVVKLIGVSQYPSESNDTAATPAYVDAAIQDALEEAAELFGADGSETVVIGQTNINVTGIGTAVDPYKLSVPNGTTSVVGAVKLVGTYPSSGNSTATTPDYVNAAMQEVANLIPKADGSETKINGGTNVTVTGSGTVASPYVVNASVNVTSNVATGNTIGSVNGVTLRETVTSITKPGNHYVYRNEGGANVVIDPAAFVSTEAGNALSTGADGRLKVVVPAQLPDDQVLTGDSSGTVALTLTPTVDPVSDNTNYTIKADLKVANQTPAAETNMFKWSPSGYYVSAGDLAVALNGQVGKVTAGTNISVTGTGSATNPYVVSVSGIPTITNTLVRDGSNLKSTVAGVSANAAMNRLLANDGSTIGYVII